MDGTKRSYNKIIHNVNNMRKLLFCLVAAAAILAGCNKSEIDALKKTTDDLDARVTALEDLQKTMWDNIQALQAIVNSADFDYVTGVKALEDGSGYEISFKKSGKIIIRHGKQGETGAVPDIGVKKAADGEYYWTLNGEFILGENGEKMPVKGDKGDKGDMGPSGITQTDGTTTYFPMMRINEDTLMWELSVDGGVTWKSTNVKASGEGESIFAENGIDSTNPDYVTFTLKDGTVLRLRKYKEFKIGTDEGNDTYEIKKAQVEIPLSFPAGLTKNECVAIMAQAISSNGTSTDIRTKASSSPWGVKVKMPTFAQDGTYNGDASLTITAPEGVVNGENALVRVTVIDSNGSETVFSRVVAYKEDVEAKPAEAGYFYYSDGSWSKDLDAAKTCIGVIFHVGDVAKDDEALQAKIGATDSGTHGLVVALKDLDPTIWMNPYAETGVSKDLNKINGYSNSLTMAAWNDDANNISNIIDIQIKMAAFISANPAPEKSSGWYLPSLKELSTLCSGWRDEIKNDWSAAGVSMRDKVHASFDKIGASASKMVMEGGQRFYWSSTDIKAGEHMAVGFDGGVARNLPSNDSNNVRSARMVLAF